MLSDISNRKSAGKPTEMWEASTTVICTPIGWWYSLVPNKYDESQGISGVEFSQDTVTGTAIPAEVEGFSENKSFFFGADEDYKTEKRDAIFQKLFGQAHPDAETETP